jgi:hypothetical protein
VRCTSRPGSQRHARAMHASATSRATGRAMPHSLLWRIACRPGLVHGRGASACSPLQLRKNTTWRAAAGPAVQQQRQEWDWEQQDIGPAFKATLDLLEWPKLCSYIKEFANTAVGRRMVAELTVPELPEVTEQLQLETRCATTATTAGCKQAPCRHHADIHAGTATAAHAVRVISSCSASTTWGSDP